MTRIFKLFFYPFSLSAKAKAEVPELGVEYLEQKYERILAKAKFLYAVTQVNTEHPTQKVTRIKLRELERMALQLNRAISALKRRNELIGSLSY